MPITLTDAERSVLSREERQIRSIYPSIAIDSMPAWHVGVMRASLAQLSMNQPNVTRDAAWRQRRLILAKLTYNAPEQTVNGYIVATTNDVFRQQPLLNKLFQKYLDPNVFGGFGRWAYDQLESVMWAMYNPSRGYPVMINAETLRQLYDNAMRQHAEALSLPEPPEMTAESLVTLSRAAPGASAAASFSRSEQRRRVGTCWQCDATKPRGVQCRVCGYTPRG